MLFLDLKALLDLAPLARSRNDMGAPISGGERRFVLPPYYFFGFSAASRYFFGIYYPKRKY